MAVWDPRWSAPWQKCHLFLFSLSLTGFPRQDRPSRTPRCRRPSGKKRTLMLAPALCSSSSPVQHSGLPQLRWCSWSLWSCRSESTEAPLPGEAKSCRSKLDGFEIPGQGVKYPSGSQPTTPVGPSPPCRGIRMAFRQTRPKAAVNKVAPVNFTELPWCRIGVG